MKMEIGADKYTLVGIDIDTTGRRLIDEIVQLSAYNPKSQYSQYIMPYMNLNPAARKRHQLQIITIGFYRMLKCNRTNKILKPKSEIATLKDFLNWIEVLIKSDSKSNGIIFLYHEERKFVPYMIIEAMKKYGLIERFLNSVKAFANGFEFARMKCPVDIKTFSIRILSKLLLKKNEILYYQKYRGSSKQKTNDANLYFEGNASVRAKLLVEIYQYLCLNIVNQCENGVQINTIKNQNFDLNLKFNDDSINIMLKYVAEITKPISNDFVELENEKKNLERQSTFRPIFHHYFESTLYHRIKAVKYRIILSESGYDYDSLKAIWTEKRKEGLTEVIQTIPLLKAERKTELIELLDAHYDPTKPSMKPPNRKFKKRNRKFKGSRNSKSSDLYSTDAKKGLKKS